MNGKIIAFPGPDMKGPGRTLVAAIREAGKAIATAHLFPQVIEAADALPMANGDILLEAVPGPAGAELEALTEIGMARAVCLCAGTAALVHMGASEFTAFQGGKSEITAAGKLAADAHIHAMQIFAESSHGIALDLLHTELQARQQMSGEHFRMFLGMAYSDDPARFDDYMDWVCDAGLEDACQILAKTPA